MDTAVLWTNRGTGVGRRRLAEVCPQDFDSHLTEPNAKSIASHRLPPTASTAITIHTQRERICWITTLKSSDFTGETSPGWVKNQPLPWVSFQPLPPPLQPYRRRAHPGCGQGTYRGGHQTQPKPRLRRNPQPPLRRRQHPHALQRRQKSHP